MNTILKNKNFDHSKKSRVKGTKSDQFAYNEGKHKGFKIVPSKFQIQPIYSL